MAVFVMSMKGQPLRKAMRYAFWFTAAGCGIIFSLAALGIYGDRVLAADTSGRGLEVRYTMGFGHPNALHCMACMLILFGLYLYGRRMKLYGYAVLFVSNLVLYALTRSESGMLTATLGIALFLLFRQAPSLPEREATYRIGEAAFAAGLLFSFWAACVKPEAPLLQRLDSVVLTGRVASLWDTVYHQGTLSTWALFSPPSNNYYFDMGWVRLVYWYGVIPAAAVLAVVFGLYRVCRLRRDGAAFLLLLTCCLYTVLEAHLVSVFLLRNMLFFLVGLYAEELFGTGEGRKEQTE